MKNLFWIITIIATIFFVIIDLLTFNEWRIVNLTFDVNNYPWGPVNDNPWYYANPGLYSTVMLIEGIIMAVLLGLVVRFIKKRNKSKIVFTLLACLGFFILMIINGKIE